MHTLAKTAVHPIMCQSLDGECWEKKWAHLPIYGKVLALQPECKTTTPGAVVCVGWREKFDVEMRCNIELFEGGMVYDGTMDS